MHQIILNDFINDMAGKFHRKVYCIQIEEKVDRKLNFKNIIYWFKTKCVTRRVDKITNDKLT